MKILRITSIGYVGGGIENGILLMRPILEKMGHTVKVLSSDCRGEGDQFSDYEFKALSKQPMLLKPFYRIFYPHSYRVLKKVLDEFQPDLVQIHSLYEVSPSVLFLLRDYPTVITVHGAEDYTRRLLVWAFPLHFFKREGNYTVQNLTVSGMLHYLYHRFISIPVYRAGFRNVNTFIVFSEYMKKMLKDDGIESVCIPNGTKLFEPVPPNEESEIIAFVGRLEKIKGVQCAITAMPHILRYYPNATLMIAGTGAYESSVRKLVKTLGLGKNILFLGHKTREQLYELYKKSAIIVVPSIWPEPFGKVGIEAMSVGRPVIASDVGGISEWLAEGVVGYLVPAGNPEAIATKIITLFGDRKSLAVLSSQAAEHAKQFSIEKHAQGIMSVYEDTIRRARVQITSI